MNSHGHDHDHGQVHGHGDGWLKRSGTIWNGPKRSGTVRNEVERSVTVLIKNERFTVKYYGKDFPIVQRNYFMRMHYNL